MILLNKKWNNINKEIIKIPKVRFKATELGSIFNSSIYAINSKKAPARTTIIKHRPHIEKEELHK